METVGTGFPLFFKIEFPDILPDFPVKHKMPFTIPKIYLKISPKWPKFEKCCTNAVCILLDWMYLVYLLPFAYSTKFLIETLSSLH